MHTSECCGVNHIRPDCTLHQHVWTTSKLVICAQIISNFKHACVCGVKILYISNLAVADEKKKIMLLRPVGVPLCVGRQVAVVYLRQLTPEVCCG